MQPAFLTSLVLTDMPDGRNWKLDAPLSFRSSAGVVITAPAGDVTDLASIPRIFWNILPPFGKYTEAAVIHDHLYRHQTTSRKYADGILLEGMKAKGVPAWQRLVIYYGVRLGGWAAWRGDSRIAKS